MITPMDGFPPATFRERRERIVERLGRSVMVLPAAPVVYASRDTEYPYRPDSELFWTTGVTEPDAVAVLRGRDTSEGPGRFVLFVRPRNEEAELWTGRRRGPEGAAEVFGADATWSVEDLDERLPGLLAGADTIHYRLGGPARLEALVRKALATARVKGPRRGEGPRGVMDPGVVLDPMRVRKDDVELQRIRQAAAISAEAHRLAMARTRPGMGEWEIQAVLEAAFRGLGGDGPAYGTIVGSGGNACVLHYVDNTSTMEAGELVLVDAGAAVGLYAGDITRTWPVDGAFTGERRAVYELVDRAREAGIGAVRPGATIADVHDAAVRVLVEGLVELGVLRGEVDALLEDDAHKPFFPHQTSHWIGLDVHDVGDYAMDDEPVALEPGMVFSVEPGLYFRPGHPRDPGSSPGAAGRGIVAEGAARFAGIGVRIEDTVVVTPDGRDVVTSGVPTDPDEVTERVGSEA